MNDSGLPRGARLLLVASTGGHLAELVLISRMIGARPDSRWVTFEHDQSSSVLSGQDVTYVPYIAPRDVRGVLRSLPTFHRVLREGNVDAVVSTGAAVAVPALLMARAFGVAAHYVESVSRFTGPSLTGRIVSALPWVRLHTQHRSWAGGRWRYDVSIADALSAAPVAPVRPGPLKVFVTLGTIKPYRFDALVDRVKALLPPEAEVTWQVGVTRRTDLPGTVHEYMTNETFDRIAREATTVVTHAGVGTVMHLLEIGARPVVVPRRAARGEHVDDHQLEMVDALRSFGGITCREVEALELADLDPRPDDGACDPVHVSAADR